MFAEFGLTYKLMNHTIVISRKNINDQVRMTPTKLLLQGIVKDADGHVLPGVAVVLKRNDAGCRYGCRRSVYH